MESAESPLSDAWGHPDADLLATPRKAVTPLGSLRHRTPSRWRDYSGPVDSSLWEYVNPANLSHLADPGCRVAANEGMWPAERGRRCRFAPAYYGFGPSARAAQQRFENEQHGARLAEYIQFGND